jgi:hypothetical protein
VGNGQIGFESAFVAIKQLVRDEQVAAIHAASCY